MIDLTVYYIGVFSNGYLERQTFVKVISTKGTCFLKCPKRSLKIPKVCNQKP